jgi:hypothetical protein
MERQRIPSRCRKALAVVLALCAGSALAGTRLDDSLSPRQHIELTSQWDRRQGEARDAGERLAVAIEARDVDIRLNTAPWTGKNAEIYILFPAAVSGLRLPNAMRIEWRTRGRFVAGVAIPGQRALVYRGPITAAVSGDIFDFTYRIDGRYFDRRLQFQPIFEIEPLP